MSHHTSFGDEGELCAQDTLDFGSRSRARSVIAGVFVGIGMTNGAAKESVRTARWHCPRVAGGTQASASTGSALKASPAQRTELALPGLTRPLRDLVNVKPGKHHNKHELSRGEALGVAPVFRPHGSGSDQGRQRSDAFADPELRRRLEHVRLPAARHRTATLARTTTCSGSTPTSRSTRRRERRSARRCPATLCGPGIRTLPVCATNNDGDPIVLYDQYSGRWLASQFAFPNFPSGPFYQCVAVSSSERPVRDLVRLPVPRCPRTSSTTIPSSGSGRRRTPTWPRSTSSSRPASAGAVSASWRSSATR